MPEWSNGAACKAYARGFESHYVLQVKFLIACWRSGNASGFDPDTARGRFPYGLPIYTKGYIMLPPDYQYFIVFYTVSDEGQNDLLHAIGYPEIPDLDDIFNGLTEFRNEIEPHLTVDRPVYMVFMGADDLFALMGAG